MLRVRLRKEAWPAVAGGQGAPATPHSPIQEAFMEQLSGARPYGRQDPEQAAWAGLPALGALSVVGKQVAGPEEHQDRALHGAAGAPGRGAPERAWDRVTAGFPEPRPGPGPPRELSDCWMDAGVKNPLRPF